VGATLTVERGEGVTFVVQLHEAVLPPVGEAQSRLL
jgi:hypothetical protein